MCTGVRVSRSSASTSRHDIVVNGSLELAPSSVGSIKNKSFGIVISPSSANKNLIFVVSEQKNMSTFSPEIVQGNQSIHLSTNVDRAVQIHVVWKYEKAAKKIEKQLAKGWLG